MKSFKDFIIEGRDSPLYHGTNIFNAERIITTNMFRASNAWSDPKTVSFSRSMKKAFLHGAMIAGGDHSEIVVFEVDQRKLSQRYKIAPFNWGGDEPERTARFLDRDDYHYNEYEEAVYSDIRDANKYITKILVKDYRKIKESGHFPVTQNYKLFDLKTNKFVNAESLRAGRREKKKLQNHAKTMYLHNIL